MAGNRIARDDERRLDRLGEDEVLRIYLTGGSVPSYRRLLDALGVTWAGLYRWLRRPSDVEDDPLAIDETGFVNRKERFSKYRQVYAEGLADDLASEILHIADDTDEDPKRSKLKMEARQWIASRLNTHAWGDRAGASRSGPTVQILATGDLHLDALRQRRGLSNLRPESSNPQLLTGETVDDE